jgi:ATP-dependent RNA helicase SUPV3L1/SUV3
MPHNWYPQARKHKRTIYYHMGPTNSGKTFEALQKLKNAKTGIYCAPLRLLAWEIYDKLTKSDIKCILKTGQEVIQADNATHFACTIEICPLTVHYDCAVIDEIQLIADDSRGSAWTNALLGLKADEIHVCGDERALNLVYNLCLLTGDRLIKKSYTRLSDLVVEEENVHSVSQLKKGDCIIAFSKREIFKLKNLINQNNFKPGDISSNPSDSKKNKSGIKNRCAVIYGSLPPETKKIQASKFNNGEDGIKYLVATDAIGLGLNLKIRRIIFSQITKRDHQGVRQLNEFEVKQIAGRAGRSDNQGHVSAFKSRDLEFIRSCCARTRHKREKRNVQQVVVYEGEDEEENSNEQNNDIYEYNFNRDETLIKKACLFPPLQIIEEFADSYMKFKNTSNSEKYKRMHPSLSETLQQFENIGKLSDLYFMKNLSELLKVHKIIEDIHEADIRTQFYFTICPIRVTPNSSKYLHFFLVQFVKYSMVKLPQDFHLQNKNFTKPVYKMHELPTFEEVYNVLEIYIWLSYKFEKEFIERELAKVMKDRVSRIIDSILHSMKFDIYSDLRNEKIESTSDEEEDDGKPVKFIEATNSTEETSEKN